AESDFRHGRVHPEPPGPALSNSAQEAERTPPPLPSGTSCDGKGCYPPVAASLFSSLNNAENPVGYDTTRSNTVKFRRGTESAGFRGWRLLKLRFRGAIG